MARFIQAKTVLSPIKEGEDQWFGIRYNMNLYRGCQHGCIYCDSRSTCYQLGDLSDIRIKENAIGLLEKELKSKRQRGTVGFGSMNDPYMPIESKEQLTCRALELMLKYRFPIHIITKSSMVMRDMDLIKKIGEIYAAISLTITSFDDAISKQIEPGAPVSSARFETINQLSKAGIYTGIVLTPVLPYITDTEENLEKIVSRANEVGAKYIIAAMGMTMREGQREFFYNELDKRFSGLKQKYINTYGNRYECNVPNAKHLWSYMKALCNEASIPLGMKFYEPEKPKQMGLF